MTHRKVILIVGAGSRMGAAVAKRFLKEGFSVILISRNESNLSALKQCLTGDDDYIFTYKSNVLNSSRGEVTFCMRHGFSSL